MIPVRVAARTGVAQDIVRLDLESLDGQALPAFTAGAHIDLVLANGLTRQYSLCGAPDRAGYAIAVLREAASRGGSLYVHDNLVPGAELKISAPRNLFQLEEDADAYVLIAGGIGITPLLSMAHRLTRLGKPFVLHYCARSQERAAFLDLLTSNLFAERVHLHFSSDPASRLNLDEVLHSPGPGRRLYVCGPAGFMDFVTEGAAQRGWSSDRLHREHFAAAPVADGEDQAFDLVLASSGQTLRVGKDQTAAQALEAAGVFVPLSCEQGICGTCLTTVIEGEPDHRDLFQTDQEKATNQQFTPCCSRARSGSLTLDL